MATAAAPDREERRAPDRRCALRRTVVLGGLFLVLAAGCFCILFYALRVRSERVWESAVAEALARGDDVSAAALLRRARTEAPHTARSARFVALETRLFALQEQRQARLTAFRERLEKLERKLNEEPPQEIPALEIAELARLAPDETALERVRRLRLRLDGRRELAATRCAQQLLNELRSLQKTYRALAAARQSGQPTADAAWQEADAKLAELKLKVRDFPELGETLRMTEELAETERAARHDAAERGKRRDRAFAALLHSDTPADAKVRCAVFLKEFPDDPAAPHVRQLVQDLAWCERPFGDAAAQALAQLREAELRTLRRIRSILRELADDASADAGQRQRARELAEEAGQLTAPDAAYFLARLGGGEELPRALRTALRERLPEAAAMLTGSGRAEDFAQLPAHARLRREFLEGCQATLPRFAGICCTLPGAAEKFHAAADLRAHAEAWFPGTEGRFARAGEIHGGAFLPTRAARPGVRALFVPEGPLDSAAKRAAWRQRAAEAGVELPPLPEFWPEE